jgi:hypothetical protein
MAMPLSFLTIYLCGTVPHSLNVDFIFTEILARYLQMRIGERVCYLARVEREIYEMESHPERCRATESVKWYMCQWLNLLKTL